MIKYRSEKEPALAAATGTIIGAAEAKKKEQEIDWQRESEIRANQLKMQLQEQEIAQQFLNEQRRKQIGIDRELRAHEWETEKMALSSQMDFTKREQIRQKKYERLLNQLDEARTKFIEQSVPEIEQQNILVDIAKNYEDDGFTEADAILGRERTLEQERRRNEAVEVKKEVVAYLGELGNLLPLDQGVDEMNKIKARLGQPVEQPVEFGGAGAGMTYPYTPSTPTATVPAAASPNVQYAHNPETGQIAVSYDGGKTWTIQ